jgi:hypothetical protein
MLKGIVVMALIAIGFRLNADDKSYLVCSAGANALLLERVYGMEVGLGGYKLIENLILFGGYGEYFGNNTKHFGNGMILFGIGRAFDRGLLLSLQSTAGLGGGIIDGSGGATYTYGIIAEVSHRIQSDFYIGVVGRYNHITKLLQFKRGNDSYEYFSVCIRITFAE